MKKALFIDSTARTITEREWDTLADLHALLGGYIEIAVSFPPTFKGDTIYVDEEGLLKQPSALFAVWSMRPDQAFAGNGVLVGPEIEGPDYPNGYTNLNPKTDIEALRRLVTFHSADEFM